MQAITGSSDNRHKLAIFASGSGSNAEKIIDYFRNSPIEVKVILCNVAGAGVIDRATKNHIEVELIRRKEFYSTDIYVRMLKEMKIDWLILAGFLWLIPSNLIMAFPRRIINIHPALLPKYGGKGMYGMNVHRAVSENRETVSGITIHYVNEKYDEGQIIFQKSRPIIAGEEPQQIAKKVLEIEHLYYPKVIESLIMGTPLIESESDLQNVD